MGIGRKNIFSITTDKDGDLWVCPRDNRLYKISVDTKGNFFVADSLVLEVNGKAFIALSITFDGSDNLWTSSNNQVTIYPKLANGHFTTNNKMVIGNEQNLQNLTINRTTITTDTSGKTVYLMHDTALGFFDVQKIVKNDVSKAPSVYLNEVQLNRKNTDWPILGISIDKYGLPIDPILTSTQNTLSFRFTSIITSNPETVFYNYKLSGIDTEWLSINTIGEADYTNLSPGKYTFYFKAANIDGIWSSPKTFSFTILQPWYNTLPAWLLWIAIGIGIMVLLFKWYSMILKKRERLKRLIIEEKLKALRAQINPNFLHNTFSFLSDTLDDQPIKKTKQIIDQLSIYLRNVLYYSNETVINLEKELSFAEEYLSINKVLFNDRFSYDISIGDKVDIFGINTPSMLFQPLLENAIKHGTRHVTGKEPAIIKINVHADDEFIYCVIGNTIHNNVDTQPFDHNPQGLQITERRLVLLFNKNKAQSYISASRSDGWYEVTIKFPKFPS